MKKIIFSISLIALAVFNLEAQDLRIQQGSTTVIRMAGGSTATSADWQIGTGPIITNQATLSRTWNEAVGTYSLTVTPFIGSCIGTVSTYSIEVFLTLPPTDPNIDAIVLADACSGGSSLATLTLNSNFPAATAYTVSYKVGAAAEQTASIAAGVNTFNIDASTLAAGSTTTVTITKFKVGTQATVVLAAGPSGNLQVNEIPTITGIE